MNENANANGDEKVIRYFNLINTKKIANDILSTYSKNKKDTSKIKANFVVNQDVFDFFLKRHQFDDKTYQATVLMTIDEAYKFPKDSSAKILTSGLLGEQYISLEAGGDDHFLKEGDRISKTQDAVVLEKLISQFLYNKATEETKK